MMATTEIRVLVIEARFYDDISDELYRGAEQVLSAARVEIDRVTVPGALEIPIALARVLASRASGVDGCVALGCVIRGETSHYDVVAGESARALMDVAISHALPLGNGILTVDTRDQAWARAAVAGKNKGGDAARACLALMDVGTQSGSEASGGQS